MIRALNHREKIIFIVTIVVIGVSIFYNILMVPLMTKKKLLAEEILVQNKLWENQRDIIQKSENLDAEYNAYGEYFHKSGTSEEITSSILSEIESLTAKYNLQVFDLKPKKTENNGFYDQFTVSLSIHSELIDVIRFLHAMQQMPYLFDIEEIEMNQSERKNHSQMKTRLILSKTLLLDNFKKKTLSSNYKGNSNVLPESIELLAQKRPLEVYEQRIYKRNIFKPHQEKRNTHTAALKKALPALHKQIRLIGILMAEDSQAIIEDLKEKQTHFLSKGESMGSVMLEDVLEDKAIFMYDNQRVEMTP